MFGFTVGPQSTFQPGMQAAQQMQPWNPAWQPGPGASPYGPSWPGSPAGQHLYLTPWQKTPWQTQGMPGGPLTGVPNPYTASGAPVPGVRQPAPVPEPAPVPGLLDPSGYLPGGGSGDIPGFDPTVPGGGMYPQQPAPAPGGQNQGLYKGPYGELYDNRRQQAAAWTEAPGRVNAGLGESLPTLYKNNLGVEMQDPDFARNYRNAARSTSRRAFNNAFAS